MAQKASYRSGRLARPRSAHPVYRMRTRLHFFLLCLLSPCALATSVVPPNFPELIAEADAIYRGRVTGVASRRVDRPDGARVIKTFVTLAIERVLKGPDEAALTLEFLGGTIGDESLDVGGVPKFAVGEHGIVFVQNNGRQFCPLVRLGHGRYRLERDPASGRDYVARDNRAPLRDVAAVETPLTEDIVAPASVDLSRALSPAAFETRIADEVRTPTPKPRPE